MTPEEKAVIEAATVLYHEGQNDHWTACAVVVAVDALLRSRITCGWCPDPEHPDPVYHQHDGEPNEHRLPIDEPATVQCSLCTATSQDLPTHMADYHPQSWEPATMSCVLQGDRIRLGTEQTIVVRSSIGTWHVDNRNEYRPASWKHTEVYAELETVPGFVQYPPNLEIELLCTPERAAVLALQRGFPGSAVISSDVN